MKIVLLLFIGLPILEMLVLIKVGGLIGAIPTILMVLLTAVIGAALLRKQGSSTWLRAQQRMQQGQMPASEMAEGLILAVGGALLLTPGFITDAIGFLCLLPFTRVWIARYVVSKALMQMHTRAHHGPQQGPFGSDESPFKDGISKQKTSRSGDVIDGEFHRED